VGKDGIKHWMTTIVQKIKEALDMKKPYRGEALTCLGLTAKSLGADLLNYIPITDLLGTTYHQLFSNRDVLQN
jgi:uncharacterized protein YbjQ (UPF0145 family)